MLTDGHRLRILDVLDEYNQRRLGAEIASSLPAAGVVQVLARLVKCHGRPTQRRAGNGPEFISVGLTEWCEVHSIAQHWIQPDKPTQNVYTERFNNSFYGSAGPYELR